MRCSRCGAENDAGARRCETCGALLSRPEGTGAGPTGVTALGFLLVILLLCGGVGFVAQRLLEAEPTPRPTTPSAATATAPAPTPPPAASTPAPASATAAPKFTDAPAQTRTAAPQPTRPPARPTPTVVVRDEDSGYRLSQVRYGLHPDKARLVLDLVVGPSAKAEPSYIVTIASQRVLVRLGVAAAPWSAAPNDAIVKRIEVIPVTAHTADLTVELVVPVARVADAVLTGPDRLVFDFFPQ